MKHHFVLLLLICLFSCENKKLKVEFVQSKKIKNLFLIKNPPLEDSLLKKEIKFFIIKNPPKYSKINSIIFYKYSDNTKYFLDNDEDDGGPTSIYFLDNYKDKDGIALFSIEKYKKDTTTLIGELRFYNSKKYNFYNPDTIIYNLSNRVD